MALTKVDDRGLNTPIDLLDNEKIRLGTSNDLEIYHDTTYNVLDSKDKGFRVKHDSDLAIETFDDGSVVLYNDSQVRLQTQGTGILYQGDLNGILHVYRTGEGTVRGSIKFDSSDVFHLRDGQSHTMIKATKDAGVELYHDNTKKFETTTAGATLSGELSATGANFTDDGQSSPIVSILADDGSPWGLQIGNSTFGDSLGLHAYCNNSGHVFFDNIGSGSTFPDWDMRLAHASTAHTMLQFVGSDTSVKLYRGGYTKFATQASGIDVFGASGTDTQVRLKDNSGNITGYLYSGSGNSVWLLDNQAHGLLKGVANGEVHLFYDNVETLATEADGIRVTDNNSSVHIKMVTSDGDAGYVYGSSNNQMGFLDNQGHWLMRGTKDGKSELMYDNTTRFQTYNSPGGTYITGRAHVQCEGDSVCQHNMTTHSSGAYHQENMGASGAVIAYVGHSSHLCTNSTSGNYAIRFEGAGLEFANSSVIQARITQHGGIAFGGDTAANNTLGDYERGNWTPTVPNGVTNLTYGNRRGWYVKVGDLVHASFYITFDAQGDGNLFQVGGLPFNSNSDSPISYSSGGSLSYKDADFTNNAEQRLYVGNNGANIYFYNNNAGTHSPSSSYITTSSTQQHNLYGFVTYQTND